MFPQFSSHFVFTLAPVLSLFLVWCWILSHCSLHLLFHLSILFSTITPLWSYRRKTKNDFAFEVLAFKLWHSSYYGLKSLDSETAALDSLAQTVLTYTFLNKYQYQPLLIFTGALKHKHSNTHFSLLSLFFVISYSFFISFVLYLTDSPGFLYSSSSLAPFYPASFLYLLCHSFSRSSQILLCPFSSRPPPPVSFSPPVLQFPLPSTPLYPVSLYR